MAVLRPTAIHLPAFFFFFVFIYFFSVHERGVGGSALQQASHKRTVFLPLSKLYRAAADEPLKGTYQQYF